MAQKSGNGTPVNPKQEPVGETASELAHRHLYNKDHETTDEEMKNIQLELGNEDENTAEREAYEKSVESNASLTEAGTPDERNNIANDKSVITPLDLLE